MYYSFTYPITHSEKMSLSLRQPGLGELSEEWKAVRDNDLASALQ